MSKLVQLSCVLLFLCSPLAAMPAAPSSQKHKPPKVTINENDTPLERLITKAKKDIDDKVASEKAKGNKDCIDSELLPDDDEKPGKKSKACDVMQFKGEKEKKTIHLEDAHKNKVGKQVKTRTKLVFDHPRQRGLTRWDDLNELKYEGRPDLAFVGAKPGSQATSMHIRTVKLPASEGINNDKDCIDRATGKRHGGFIRDESNQWIENPDSCFDQSGALKKTLTLVEGGTGECVHANGRIYSAEECDELKLTTLEELIDEDRPETAGQAAVDGDEDGNVLDVPELGTGRSPCAENGGDLVAGSNGESCDFTRAMRLKANKDAKDNLPPGKQKKLFKIDDTTGACDPDADGEYACGEEPREYEVEETVTLRCPPGGIYEEDRCLIPPADNPSVMSGLALSGSTRTLNDYAMMGFTFAPPVLEWGINEVSRVCIFGWCFEVFAVRFGYEFEIAAGLRLPVKVTVNDIPTAELLAGQDSTMAASLEPADFTVKDYTAFCQQHNLDRSWWIADCNRFAFPEYFESMLPDWMFDSPGDRQGSEFVAQNTTFAGLQVRVFSIPVVNFAVDASVNVPAMCTLYKMKKQIFDGSPADWIGLLANFGKNLEDSKNFMKSLEGTLTNCASFTTPYGYDETGEPRQFPFLTGSFDIPADCTREIIEGEALAVGGEKKPMCTGLKVSIYGATLGLGLQLVPQAFSDLIKAKATTSGDAQALDQTLRFHQSAPGQNENPSVGPVRFDNYDLTTDTARISLDDFVYHLNNFGVQVNGLIEVGGILAFIGNVATVPLVDLRFDFDDDLSIPIPQHPGTGPISIDVPVVNYGLSLDGKTKATDPMRVNDETLRVAAGTSGVFDVWVKNEGTVPDTMDNFTYAVATPNDGVDDSAGQNPVNRWTASFGTTSVANVPAHNTAATPVSLTVVPVRHPLTRPGNYPLTITADSRGARDLKLATVDPSIVSRLGAKDVVLVTIEPFFGPEVTVAPLEAAIKPGKSVTYTVTASNSGNVADQEAMNAVFAESDTAGCTLASNGRGPECPYRAKITRIDPATWTSVAELNTMFPETGFFKPTESGQDSFTIRAPADWAGMQDTVYSFTLSATSTADPANPKAKSDKTATFKVLATRESMARYVNLEIAEFMAQIDQADAQGIRARGIQPVMLHPVTMMTTRALEQTLAGDFNGSSKSFSTALKVMEAVDRMVNGAGLPEPLATDWKARSAAILTDMTAASASVVSSQ